MTATWSTAARRRFAPAAAGLIFSLAGWGIAAGQDREPAPACAAERCLAVRIDPSVRTALADGSVTTAALADGLRLDFEGSAPLAVRVIAARYDNGRLVRYGVSPRIDLAAAGGDLAVAEALPVIDKAFQPATTRVLSLEALDHDLLSEDMPVRMEAFVGEVPTAYLAGEETGLLDLSVAPEDLPTVFDGSFGVVVAVPDDDALRGPDQIQIEGALLGLSYERPSATSAPTG